MAAFALLAIAVSLLKLERTTDGLTRTQTRLGTIPVTVFARADAPSAPVAVIAHGFAGSQQLMLPFALTLARSGYIAVTFDFPGHARNSAPLAGGLADSPRMTAALLTAIDTVIDYARALPQADGRVALVGHSMASDVVVRQAQADDTIAATVAVSLFFPGATATLPHNLLIVDGALEARQLRDEGLKIVAQVANGPPEPGVTYGDPASGTGRRLALARGVEHIGVLYSGDSLREARDWLDATFSKTTTGDSAAIDVRGRWLGLLYLGLIALAWPLAALLPRMRAPMPGVSGAPATSPSERDMSHAQMPLAGRAWWAVAVIPALVTPLILWRLPTDFLPLLLGDYLMLHFALYGALTLAGLIWFGGWFGGWFGRRFAPPIAPRDVLKLAMAVLLVTGYSLFAIGLPIDAYVTSVVPGSHRAPLIAALLIGTLPYFVADEWLTRGTHPARGLYVVTKVCFVLSLVIAVALNLEKLFFLVIIVPVVIVLFIVYGLFSRWTFQRTQHSLVAGLANALVFAWFVAVTFPVVSR